jgi:nitrate/nitrite transporter NarK
VGGVVGALGGFVLPQLSAFIKSATGSIYLQILPLVALAAIAAIVQFVVVSKLSKSGKSTLDFDAMGTTRGN